MKMKSAMTLCQLLLRQKTNIGALVLIVMALKVTAKVLRKRQLILIVIIIKDSDRMKLLSIMTVLSIAKVLLKQAINQTQKLKSSSLIF